MAKPDMVRPAETETLPSTQAASTYQCNEWHMGWGLPQEHLHPQRLCPYFRKRVMKGSLHQLPQSVICVPTHFVQEHPDTFLQGNLITLEGPSGNTWKVRASGKPILHSGWRAFAHDHDLREGDQLCFALTKPLHFVLDIWNGDGGVKESALTATITGKYAVASVCFPYEYVHRPRKRKGKTTAAATTTVAPTYHVVPGTTIASRCKTTARDRSGGPYYYGYPLGARLRFSHTRKQWECREEKDGREVVTILDSDDEAATAAAVTATAEEENRLLDHIELSFGSAQVQSYRMNKSQRLVTYMKEQGECVVVPPWSNPAPVALQVIAMADKDQRTVATQTILREQEITGHGEEELNKVADNQQQDVDPLMVIHPKAAATELIIREITTNQAQICRDADTRIEETNLTKLVQSEDVQLQIAPDNVAGADSEVLQSHTIPTASEKAPAERKSAPVGPLTEKAGLPATESHEVLTAVVARGEFLFERLQKIDVDTINIVQKGEDPIRPDSALTNRVNNSRESESGSEPKVYSSRECQSSTSSASNLHKQVCEPVCELLPVTKMTKAPGDFNNPATITAWVLTSKRVPVAKLHRAKTLRAAQALTKKLRSPNFLAVMTSANVYTDFTLDIPPEFAKRSRLPAVEARATLVCDEVPTMCKAVWVGTDPEKPKLDAHAWMEFSRSHFLEEGDVCVFELFNRVTIRIGIHIFRVVGLRRSSLPTHWTQHYNVVQHLDAAQHQPSCAGAALPLGSSRSAPSEAL